MPIPVVDSHIHLFAASHLPTLAWYTPHGPLSAQHSIDEYRHATSSVSSTSNTNDRKYLKGFIFLETDRISSVEDSKDSDSSNKGWKYALEEVSFLSRIVKGEPISGEGHNALDKDMCLGIVPWAPVPGGPAALDSYMSEVKIKMGQGYAYQKVRGVRYLVQDKPAGIMLENNFIEGLRWLGKEGLTFDLGVDARQGGLGQLREAVEMMERLYSSTKKSGDIPVTIVINHLCKPNLRLTTESVRTHPEYLGWKDLITRMAQITPTTYMKLSGAFSELLPLSPEEDVNFNDVARQIQPWTDVVFDVFGRDRVMFGSDWPVANIGGGGNDVAWNRWRRVVEILLDKKGFNDQEKANVWGQVAVKAYGIEL